MAALPAVRRQPTHRRQISRDVERNVAALIPAPVQKEPADTSSSAPLDLSALTSGQSSGLPQATAEFHHDGPLRQIRSSQVGAQHRDGGVPRAFMGGLIGLLGDPTMAPSLRVSPSVPRSPWLRSVPPQSLLALGRPLWPPSILGLLLLDAGTPHQ